MLELIKSNKTPKYKPLSSDDSLDEEAAVTTHTTRQRKIQLPVRISISWLLVALLSTYVAYGKFFGTQCSRRLWTSTDFVPARAAIKSTKVQFTSSLDFIDPDQLYRIYDPLATVYVGAATAEIDQAWDNLTKPEVIDISDEEARTMPEGTKLYRDKDSGKFMVGIEVFHNLHCLNMIRKRLYREDYPEMQTANAKVHIDHCIESFREMMMCEGNMTPIPIEWSDKGERENPNYAQLHSCRDFGTLKSWMKRRAAGIE